MPGIGEHFVWLVPVVQPVTVNESVLQPDRRDTATSAFEDERAAPAAGLGVGQRHCGAKGIEGGRGFVHRTRGPRPLQQRNSSELVADDAPAVVTANDG